MRRGGQLAAVLVHVLEVGVRHAEALFTPLGAEVRVCPVFANSVADLRMHERTHTHAHAYNTSNSSIKQEEKN